MKSLFLLALLVPLVLPAAEIQGVEWQHLSTTRGDLQLPGKSTEQTGAVVADFDRDGTNDFIISFRKVAPALVWYQRVQSGWVHHIIEPDLLTVEAGGAVQDIDGDGDLDVVFGGDWQSNEVWWWENPYPAYDSKSRWKRRTIKSSGANQHHDQAFGDFLGTGKAQLAFWNQGAKKIYLAPIPDQPREAKQWELIEIFSGEAGELGRAAFRYPEGMSTFDMDGDGRLDLLAGNLWLKHRGGTDFEAIQISPSGGLIFAGRFKPGKHPQVVIAPGDGTGPVKLFECVGNPLSTKDWVGRDLLGRAVVHGHSLQLADVNRDGHLDIFIAEMAKWSPPDRPADNPKAKAWLLYGDGAGTFKEIIFTEEMGYHEARVADLNGDGKLDILNKPYTWQAPRLDVWLQR